METPERLKFEKLSITSPSTPQSSSVTRLWRPAAQRNLRNQWSKLAACRQRWTATSSNGRSQATSLVNAYLSQRYMPAMNLGVLSDFPNIKEKALRKLFKQQELHRTKLLMAYKDMVATVLEMIGISKSMRCYTKGATSSPLAQFSNCSDANDDSGDGDGIPVYRHLSIPQFEILAEELIQMFKLELHMKRRLVLELLSISSKENPEADEVSWSSELYPGELEQLNRYDLNSEETNQLPFPPSNSQSSNHQTTNIADESISKILEVYLTLWLSEVNLNADRLDEIFTLAGSEMQISFK